jgi:hypothetical protein
VSRERCWEGDLLSGRYPWQSSDIPELGPCSLPWWKHGRHKAWCCCVSSSSQRDRRVHYTTHKKMQTSSKEIVPFGNEKNGLELELTFDWEVLDGKMILPIVHQALVKLAGLLCLNICQVIHMGLVLLSSLFGVFWHKLAHIASTVNPSDHTRPFNVCSSSCNCKGLLAGTWCPKKSK